MLDSKKYWFRLWETNLTVRKPTYDGQQEQVNNYKEKAKTLPNQEAVRLKPKGRKAEPKGINNFGFYLRLEKGQNSWQDKHLILFFTLTLVWLKDRTHNLKFTLQFCTVALTYFDKVFIFLETIFHSLHLF